MTGGYVAAGPRGSRPFCGRDRVRGGRSARPRRRRGTGRSGGPRAVEAAVDSMRASRAKLSGRAGGVDDACARRRAPGLAACSSGTGARRVEDGRVAALQLWPGERPADQVAHLVVTGQAAGVGGGLERAQGFAGQLDRMDPHAGGGERQAERAEAGVQVERLRGAGAPFAHRRRELGLAERRSPGGTRRAGARPARRRGARAAGGGSRSAPAAPRPSPSSTRARSSSSARPPAARARTARRTVGVQQQIDAVFGQGQRLVRRGAATPGTGIAIAKRPQ